jgi:anti-sigma B factor antagonist
MSVHSRREGETVVVAVEGQLIAGNKQQLRDAVNLEIDRGARRFVIDFAETGYIDSAGLGALVSISKKIRDSQGSLRIAHLNEDLRTLFELTRLNSLFVLDEGDGSPGGVGASTPRPRPAPGGRTPEDDARA